MKITKLLSFFKSILKITKLNLLKMEQFTLRHTVGRR